MQNCLIKTSRQLPQALKVWRTVTLGGLVAAMSLLIACQPNVENDTKSDTGNGNAKTVGQGNAHDSDDDSDDDSDHDNQVAKHIASTMANAANAANASAALSASRLQTIENLAGVPMAKLATFDPQEIKQGGDTGITITSSESYSKPSFNITASRKGNFFIGNAFFKQPWVVAPASTDSRDGLGALFNVAACQSCHIKDGRGHAPMTSDDSADSLLIRLAMPATTAKQQQQLANSDIEKVAHPVYGGQLQDRGIQGVPAEANIAVSWADAPVTFQDGYVMTLRRPTFQLKNPGYGEFDVT